VELSLPALANRIPTEADAYTLLEEMRWHGKPVCPHCGSIDKHYFLKPRNGISCETSCGNQTQRRLWKCSACRMQFSVLTGTVMHGTKIPVRTWLFVAFEFASSKNGVAAREIERKYRLHGNSAWTLCHRLREAMRLGPYSALFVGTVIADETYVGGEVSNNHRQGDTAKRARGRKPGGPAQKTPVFSIVHQQTGEVRSWVLADVNSRSVGELLSENVDIPRSILFTDSSSLYSPIGPSFMGHEAVDHRNREYVNANGAGTNAAEGYFSQLKRSIDGTHHHVSRTYLNRYLGEFDFRYSTCEMTDGVRMEAMFRQSAGRRLAA
jgi:transposase-like protein